MTSWGFSKRLLGYCRRRGTLEAESLCVKPLGECCGLVHLIHWAFRSMAQFHARSTW